MSTQQPLAAFSLYLSGRNQVLLSLAAEIVQLLDQSGRDDDASAAARTRASDLMWLWTLAAYEVTRTMCQSQPCFSPPFFRAILNLKADIERVRVPNAKLEKIKYDRKGPTIPVSSNRPPDAWDRARQDLLVGDPADPASARALLASYARVLSSLTAADVLASHEAAFTRK